jgi:hypothetical protein
MLHPVEERGYAQTRFRLKKKGRSDAMQKDGTCVVVNEFGAIIPRSMFGRENRIVEELRQAGVFSPRTEENAVNGSLRGEMPNRSRELNWIKEHRKEFDGQWVALDGDRLLSHGPNSQDVIAAARQSGVEAPYIVRLETKVRRVPPIDISREKQWLKEHRHEYLGQWVALDGDRLLSHGTDARAVSEAAREAGIASPFLAHMDPDEEIPFGGW